MQNPKRPKRPKRIFTIEDINTGLKIAKCNHKETHHITYLKYGYFIRSCVKCGKRLELSRGELTDFQKEVCSHLINQNMED